MRAMSTRLNRIARAVAALTLAVAPVHARAAAVAAQSTHEHHHQQQQPAQSRPARRAPKKKVLQAGRRTTVRRTVARAVAYSCPMHPEVTSGRAGSCPKCRMDLVAAAPAQTLDARGVPMGEAAQGKRLKISAARMRLINVRDRDGKRINLYDDLVRGRSVAVHFMTAPCPDTCEPLAHFREAQRRMGERLGPYVRLVTVFTDGTPPEQLRRLSAAHEAGDGWTMVSADKAELAPMLRAFGQTPVASSLSAPPLVVGNDAAGYWTQLDATFTVPALVQTLGEASSKDAVVTGVTNTTP